MESNWHTDRKEETLPTNGSFLPRVLTDFHPTLDAVVQVDGDRMLPGSVGGVWAD